MHDPLPNLGTKLPGARKIGGKGFPSECAIGTYVMGRYIVTDEWDTASGELAPWAEEVTCKVRVRAFTPWLEDIMAQERQLLEAELRYGLVRSQTESKYYLSQDDPSTYSHVDLNAPLLCLWLPKHRMLPELGAGEWILPLGGQHRLLRARAEGKEWLPVHILHPTEEKSIRVKGNMADPDLTDLIPICRPGILKRAILAESRHIPWAAKFAEDRRKAAA